MADATYLSLRIREARADLGLTQTELANRAGVTLRAVQQWEYAERKPRLGHVPALAAALAQPVAYFFEPASGPLPAEPAKDAA